MAKIKEIFTSIQGEGRYVGYKQLFIRFCGCNMKCRYCDTDYTPDGAQVLLPKDINRICSYNDDCHSVALTGGEPLLQIKFIKEFIPKCPLPVYLETNGILYGNLMEIIQYLSYISMDIKLPSATGNPPRWDEHNRFLNIAVKKDVFAKVVFDENITLDEIRECLRLCKRHGTEIFLQPVTKDDKIAVPLEFIEETYDKFISLYDRVRVVPQVHKYLGIR